MLSTSHFAYSPLLLLPSCSVLCCMFSLSGCVMEHKRVNKKPRVIFFFGVPSYVSACFFVFLSESTNLI